MVKEQDLEQSALNSLRKCLGEIPFLRIEKIEQPEVYRAVDLEIQARVQGQPISFLIEVKNNGQPRWARLAAYQLKDRLEGQANGYGIFVAPYISPRTGAICEEAGIGYLDLAGNCLISFGTVYIRQTGQPNLAVQKRDLRSLYSPKAERILRVMYNEPKRIWKFTELSQVAQVSLGQVANVKKLILDREWIDTSKDGFRLINLAALLDEWAQAYNFRRNGVQDYYALAELPEIEARLAETCRQLGLTYALTSFSSAARLAPMVRYQKSSAYVSGDVEELIQALDWKAAPSGSNVSLILPYDAGVFYGAKEIDEIMIVTPVQTYLDLQSVHGRGQEAAQAVRKEMEKQW